MTNPIALTFSAILLTFFGKAPISVWFPLFKDVFANILNMII